MSLEIIDSEIYQLIKKEEERQKFTLELIASENFVSEAVLEAQGSVLTNKYAEGYPGKKYYGGCQFIDEVENSLHPQAQRRFVQYLLKLARIKKLQIILSTHSPFVLEELPDIARIMLVRLSDRKDIMYEVSSQFALSTIDDKAHPELFAFLEDEEAVALFWEILKHDSARYDEFCKKISARPVGSCSVVGTLNELGKNRKLPYCSIAIVDGDKKNEHPNCLSLPGDLAPEKQVITDLKSIGWNRLDERFGIGAGTLFKHLDDAILLPDHHEWTTYIGDHVKKSKDTVWSILIEEWHKQCLNEEVATKFIEDVYTAIRP
jgi:hypothetical protein